MNKSLTSTADLKDFYNLDFVVPFEVDVEVGTSFGDGIEVEFDNKGTALNIKELTDYVENH